MVVKRVVENKITKSLYESSNIIASTYDKVNGDLNITFKNGGNYTYQNVTASDFTRFETSESQGKALNQFIKKYSFLKHDKIDVDNLILEIELIKDRELVSESNLLAKELIEVSNNYNVSTTFMSLDTVDYLINKLTNYKKIINERN